MPAAGRASVLVRPGAHHASPMWRVRRRVRVAASGRVSRREGMVSIDEQGSAAGNRSPDRAPAMERL